MNSNEIDDRISEVMLSSSIEGEDEHDKFISTLLLNRQKMKDGLGRIDGMIKVASFALANIVVFRMQNIEYPHHGQFINTVKEVFRNDFSWLKPRLFYMAIIPLTLSLGVNFLTYKFAIWAKQVYVTEARKRERSDFIQSLDKDGRDKITWDELVQKLGEKYFITDYIRQAICPAIIMIGFALSQPFYVIAVHVANTRYLDTNGGRY